MKKEDKKNLTFYFNFGYKNFGPILVGFSNWLNEELKRRDIKKVFFLSRDGYIMKKAFDYIYGDKYNTKYFYASRRAIIVPSLWKLQKKDEIFDAILFSKDLTIDNFIKKIGLENYDLKEILNKYGLKSDEKYELEKLKNNKNFNLFLEEIFPYIKENSKKEYECFEKYIKKMSFEGKLAIIDIGWNGTMQNAIYNITKNNEIYGFYMGLCPTNNFYDNNAFKGFIFDKGHGLKNYEIIYKNFLTVFEFLTLAQHGSVKCFNKSESDVELYEYEYKGLKEEEISKKIQDGGMEYVKKHVNDIISLKEAINHILKVGKNPTLNDAKMLGDIRFMDNDFKYIAKNNANLFNIKKLLSEYKESSWKIGFMKRTLKINLPYYKINEKLRNIYNKNKENN